MTVDLKKLSEKFFTDPDWVMMEELLLSYLEPFRSNKTITTEGKSNDEIATEVKGRNLMIDALERFLGESKVVTRRLEKPTTFK